jgi:integrase
MAQLTDIAIRNLKPKPGPKAWEKPDGRGLYVFVGVTGAKSFVCRYRIGGKPAKVTIGRWLPPEERSATPPTDARMGDPMSLATARKLAADIMLQLNRGHDPAATKRDEAQAKQQAAADTFERIAVEYLARDGDKLRSKRDRERTLRTRVFPALGHIPISQLKKSDVVRLLDKLEEENGPVAADRCLAFIRRVLNSHAERDDDYRPPLLRMKPRKSASEQARDRILDDRELRAVWQASSEMPGPFAALVRFLLLMGARRTEASAMRWDEIKGTDWTLPASRNKAAARSAKANDLTRPLSAAARAVLDGLPRVGDYVFTADGQRPLTGYSKPKRRFDEAVARVLAEQDAKENQLPIPVPRWVLHDLRRTSASLMQRAGVPREHIEACLGHVVPGVAGIYQRHKHHAEMARAYEMLAAEIERTINPPAGDNIVVFGKT